MPEVWRGTSSSWQGTGTERNATIPVIPGLYQLINQQFCARRWGNVKFINREQDLGIPGLRDAKLSYGPDHLVRKYRIMLKG